FFALLAHSYVQRIKKPVFYFGEKTPAHSGYVPQIRRVFPEAKFIWIYRDGRDVALSLRKVPWMDPNLAVDFLVWLFYYAKQMQTGKDNPGDVHFVKYEDLVSQPASELSRITAFLGIPFESGMANGYGNREGVLPWEYPWKARALEPITTERI